jgi:nucleoside 2-deoxyribosyltransferase
MMVYIAAPLSNEAERTFNLRLRDFLRQQGFSSYLPQEDGGLMSEFVRQGEPEEAARQRLFRLDFDYVEKCDILLALLDGRVLDEGVCFELGVAYSLRKTCIGFKTDSRSSIRGRDNLMIEGSLKTIARNWQELQDVLGILNREHSE